MKNFKLLLLLVILFSTGCSNDDDDLSNESEVTIEDFVGSWKATSLKFTNNSDSAEQFDFISNGGELRFTMLTGGKVRIWIEIGGISDEWDSLAVLKNSTTMVVTPVEAARGTNTFKFVLNNNSLTLTNEDDSFDFTLSGGDEVSATSVAVLQKN
jgi:hypothetical protein